jgi:hypothetical protein
MGPAAAASPHAFTGSGTATLSLTHGVTITIDPTRLSIPTINLLAGALGKATMAPFTFTDLPGTCDLFDPRSSGTTLEFTLNAGGTVTHDASQEGIVTGNGTNALTVVGVALNIDATAVSSQSSSFTVENAITLSTAQAQTLVVLPGTFLVQVASFSFKITVAADDTIDYDASLDNQLSGRGTDTLVISALA